MSDGSKLGSSATLNCLTVKLATLSNLQTDNNCKTASRGHLPSSQYYGKIDMNGD